jgi:transposase-like protein
MNDDHLISLPPTETTEGFSDALSDLIRRGARQIIAQAVEAELEDFLAQYRDRRDERGRQVVVRNGYLPERMITKGVGEVAKGREDHRSWQQRSLRQQRDVYIWVDGIYFNIRANERQCLLVIFGVTDKGHKERLGLEMGYRESELSWTSLLLRLQDQGLTQAPYLAISDGALGFWKALPQVFPTTKAQRCWVHKTANVLKKLPKRQQPEAKRAIWEIYRADSKTEAQQVFNRFIATYQAKYPEATNGLAKDRDVLLTFFDFPAEHWAQSSVTFEVGPLSPWSP